MSACGCKKYCTDLPEHKDDPNAQCKGRLGMFNESVESTSARHRMGRAMIEATIWIDPVSLEQVHHDPHGEDGSHDPGEYHRDWGFVEALPFTIEIGRGLNFGYYPTLHVAIARWHRTQPQRVLANLYEGWDQELGSWPPYGARRYPDGDRMAEAAHYATLDSFSRVLRDTWKDSIVAQMRDANRVLYGGEKPRRLDWWGR